MKLYKVSVMTKVFGYEYFYQKHGEYTLVADKDYRFMVDVKAPRPKRKTTYITTILDCLRGQKCQLTETDELFDRFCELKAHPEGELSEKTGIVLPYKELGADVIRTQSNKIVMVDKDQLDVFNWYELFADRELIKGIYCDGVFFIKALPYDLAANPKVATTISLLNEMR